jgi:uncharacterized NAD(P)/FAD-binding protein YdhS
VISVHVEDVAVIGGGAAGVLLVAHLARITTRPLRITIVDDGPGRLGSGVAYATADPDHLLNVRTTNLSAWSDEPEHFVSWLARRGTPALPSDYVGRPTYGAYLAAVAADAGNGPLARVRHLHAHAVEVQPGWHVHLSDGSTLAARHVVLATGVGRPAPIPAAEHRPRYLADPWRPGALDAVGDTDPVLVIGTGLTAIDVATTLGRGNRRLHAISRHGLVPAAHLTFARAPMPLDDDVPGDLAALRRLVRARITASVARTGDWRPAVDGLRPHTPRLWAALDAADKRAFLRRDRRRWEVARHRMAPRVAASIAAMRASGQLTISAGDAVEAIAGTGPDTWIVNATGPESDLRRCPDPLLRRLLTAGHVRPGPCGIGIATAGPGQLLDAHGSPTAGLWTLGANRRGDLWESTAIPEIRDQARHLAERLLATLAPPAASAISNVLTTTKG